MSSVIIYHNISMLQKLLTGYKQNTRPFDLKLKPDEQLR
jgi:hypothetical protein